MCVLGNRLLKDIKIDNCTKDIHGELHQLFCPNNTCDPYYAAHNVSIIPGIKVNKIFRYVVPIWKTYPINSVINLFIAAMLPLVIRGRILKFVFFRVWQAMFFSITCKIHSYKRDNTSLMVRSPKTLSKWSDQPITRYMPTYRLLSRFSLEYSFLQWLVSIKNSFESLPR